jgi:FimV-like protein
LKKIIQKEEVKVKAEKITKTKLIRKWISIGSLAIAASFSGIFYSGYLNNCSNLADRYYVAYVNIYELPSRGGETLHPTPADSLFFDALKQLEKGQNRSAAKQLATLQNKQAELHATTENAVKWYLSLAYLKNGQKSKAKELLHELINDSSSEFKVEANGLLKELEN